MRKFAVRKQREKPGFNSCKTEIRRDGDVLIKRSEIINLKLY